MRTVQLFVCLAVVAALGTSTYCDAATKSRPFVSTQQPVAVRTVTTIVYAESSGEAIAKAQRRYPGYTVIDIKRASPKGTSWIVRLRAT
jgi:ActR/RegA family two-component response regulator